MLTRDEDGRLSFLLHDEDGANGDRIYASSNSVPGQDEGFFIELSNDCCAPDRVLTRVEAKALRDCIDDYLSQSKSG